MSHHFSRRDFIKTSALAMPFILAGCAHRAAGKNRADDFVGVQDGRFQLHDRPYYYVGANAWFGCYLSDAALPGGRARFVRELDQLQSLGVNNVRLLAGSETSPLVGAIPRGITRAPHDYDEALLAGLDFCLAEMARRNMRGILFVSNYWQWSGSFAQYVRWITGGTIPDPEFGSRRACSEFVPPAQPLGPHVAALGMRFYTGSQFPVAYRNQVFIAEHGSWNRSRKIGYRISLVRLDAAGKALSYESFAEGWLDPASQNAWGRPADVLVAADGSLLVSDDTAGAIYRIRYRD